MKFEIVKSESSTSLGDYLKDKLQLSGKAVRRLLESGACKVNGRFERFANYKLGTGDKIDLLIPETKKSDTSSSFEKKRVLFEDEYILIYDKPSGINTDPKGILPIIRQHAPHAELVHRLDQGTTGALLLAKDKNYLPQLEDLFRSREVTKTYFALVDGAPRKKSGVIENHLGPLKKYAGQSIWGEVEGGQLAITRWEVRSVGKDASLVVCRPETGRTHQIRVHMSGIGHPLLGDLQYGKIFKCKLHVPRVMLHAESLEFTHPFTEKILHVSVPIPLDFRETMKNLEKSGNL